MGEEADKERPRRNGVTQAKCRDIRISYPRQLSSLKPMEVLVPARLDKAFAVYLTRINKSRGWINYRK